MNESISTREIIERLVKQSGLKKKLAAGLMHALPEIIEEGLKKDGEVRVKGLGTFRLKWVKERVGRNPKTGEKVPIPPHNRIVFLPETSFKEYVNRDLQMLSYEVIDEPVATSAEKNLLSSSAAEVVHEPEKTTEPQPESQAGASKPKRRVHWIIPTAIMVIIILSVIFYFRNFYQSEDRIQKTEDRIQETEDRIQETEVDSSLFAVPSSHVTDSTQISELETPNSELSTPNSELLIVPEGKRLFQLAREAYGNPFLWVLIYRANQAKITDPDLLITGTELDIPVLEGAPGKLTANDSLAVSEGYRLVYEFFKAKGDSRADNFYKGIGRYKPD